MNEPAGQVKNIPGPPTEDHVLAGEYIESLGGVVMDVHRRAEPAGSAASSSVNADLVSSEVAFTDIPNSRGRSSDPRPARDEGATRNLIHSRPSL